MKSERKLEYSRRRRQIIIFAFLIVGIFPLFFRLFDYQVVRADELNEEAKGRRSVQEIIYGNRGQIIDSNGVILAQSVKRHHITAAPKKSFDSFRRYEGDDLVEVSREQAISELATVLKLKSAEVKSVLDNNADSLFAYLKKSVDSGTLEEVQKLNIPWISSEQVSQRSYPNGAVAGNLIGFMNVDGPGAGLELYMDKCLASKDGSAVYEQGLDGVRLPSSDVENIPAEDGSNILLTLNSDLQWYSQGVLAEQVKKAGAEWGTALVIETKTGKLRAVAEYPTVDSNNPGASIPETWTSRSFTSLYEPGSTMKTVAMAALLDAGKITPLTQLKVASSRSWGYGVKVTDYTSHPVLNLTASGVLRESSNVGTALLAEKLSKQKRYEYYKEFGFGTLTEVEFQGEENGILPLASDWDMQTDLSINFGQGIAVTAAQMAQSYQVIANNGVKLPLILVEGCVDSSGKLIETPKQEETRIISESAAKQTQNMLETVVNGSYLEDRIGIPGYRVGAKTGTAEVVSQGVYTDDVITSIIGMVPMDDPEYVVAVTIGLPSKDKTSSGVAPAFKKIMTQIIKSYRLEPSRKAEVELDTTW